MKTHLPRMPSSAFASCSSAASTFLSSEEVTMIPNEGLSSQVLPLHFCPTKLEKQTPACSFFQGSWEAEAHENKCQEADKKFIYVVGNNFF